MLSADFFSKSTFTKNSFKNTIRHDVLSGLIWFQIVCKGYQQSTLGGKEINIWQHFILLFTVVFYLYLVNKGLISTIIILDQFEVGGCQSELYH